MISIEIKGLKELMQIADKYPAISEKHVNNAISNILNKIKTDVINSGPYHTGKLRNSWAIKIKKFEGSLRNIAQPKDSGNKTFYAYYIENGTQPYYPNSEKGGSLDLWAKSKGIPTFLVARSISRKGIKPQRFLQKAINSNQQIAENYIDKALSNIIKEL